MIKVQILKKNLHNQNVLSFTCEKIYIKMIYFVTEIKIKIKIKRAVIMSKF
jgi:hypothetical protein